MFVDGGPGKKEIVSDQLITGDSAVATGSHRVIAPRAEVSQTTGRGRALVHAAEGRAERARPQAVSERTSSLRLSSVEDVGLLRLSEDVKVMGVV